MTPLFFSFWKFIYLELLFDGNFEFATEKIRSSPREFSVKGWSDESRRSGNFSVHAFLDHFSSSFEDRFCCFVVVYLRVSKSKLLLLLLRRVSKKRRLRWYSSAGDFFWEKRVEWAAGWRFINEVMIKCWTRNFLSLKRIRMTFILIFKWVFSSKKRNRKFAKNFAFLWKIIISQKCVKKFVKFLFSL